MKGISLMPLKTLGLALLAVLAAASAAPASDAPGWMHAAAGASLPAHDEKTNAVLIYEERVVNVQSADKIKTQVRVAYKILRPEGREYGWAGASFNAHSKITGMRAWCIPAQGKDYEVKDKDAVDMAMPKIDGAELVSDVRMKFLQIPAAAPGSVVGYEYEQEENPVVLQDEWDFQEAIPVRETHYSLQLPPGWAYKAFWMNYPESKPAEAGSQLQWSLNDVKAIRPEADMPPFSGVAGHMVVNFFPQGGAGKRGFTTWAEMGTWYQGLITDRRDASSALKQQVATLTASSPATLDKMRAVANFVQHDIRYVAIELGIGGFQPHAATETFDHRYGDCKDKATLLSSMLHEIGVDSYYVVINTRRGSVTAETPAYVGAFNHAILAIKLPADLSDSSLVATVQHPKLGRLLFFDPTNDLTPFGEIGGYLQSNYGLLVTPDGGELVRLPEQPPAMNGVERTAKLVLDASGTLKGDVSETRIGDRAWMERARLHNLTNSKDRIKPIEDILAGSLSLFHVTSASIVNLDQTDQPFGFRYSFEAQNYAKNAGGLIVVRPRVLGVKAREFLDTKEPRRFPIEFESPVHDVDNFDITIPPGYVADDVPSPVDADYDFASYHSKTEVKDNVIYYSRSYEVKDLSVPISRAADLKKFFRMIAGDERNSVLLKPAGQ
jgi:hypothetical protein